MNVRIRGLVMLGLVMGLSTAQGKPPGLPADPLVEGKEPTVVAREFYLSETKAVCEGPVRSDPDAFWMSLRRVLPQWLGHTWNARPVDSMSHR